MKGLSSLHMKAVSDLGLQFDSKKTLSCIDHQSKSFNTNIAKVWAQNVFFCLLMILNQLIGQPQINLQDYGFVRISTTHLFSNWQSKKQFRNLPIGIYPASCLKMIQTMNKISLLGLCLHTKRAHCWLPSIFTALIFPYWFAEEHNCDMHPYITESDDVKYAGSITSACVIDTISSCAIIFHRHHQSLYWRRILPRSNHYWWLRGNGIWCNTIDSR